jgi:hypothetical protein
MRAALVLLLAVTGCTAPWHKQKQAQQPPLAPPVLPANPPPPNNSIDLPPSKDEANIPSFPKQQVKPPVQPKRTRKSTPKQPVQAAQPSTVQQADAAPAEVSAIGVLGSVEATDSRNETQRSINDVERGLNSINRKMNDQEQRTVALIRENIKQARTALSSGDMDGAHTLAIKARVLLGELNP